MTSSHISPAAPRAQRCHLGASILVVVATLAGCAGDAEEPEDGAVPAATASEHSADPATSGPAESRSMDSEQPTSDAENAAPDAEKAAPNPLQTTPDDGEDPSGDTDSAVSSGGEREVPTEEDADAGAVPPEFYAADTVLAEDAFDGPDLALGAVDLAVEDVHQVVLTLEGSGFPGWQVEYVDVAEAPIGAESQSVLKVALVGVGSTDVGLGELPDPDGRATQVVVEDGTNGVTAYLAFAREPAPFRVYLQHAPLRLVVEVAAGA